MDSITQAFLGAAVGGAHLGPRIGRRALWLGAAVATVPDLDVLLIPLLDDVAELTAHRTYTHNLLFLLLASPLLGLLLARLQPAMPLGRRDWTVFAALCLATAVALDCFTAYGVPLLYPFSYATVAIASISVVDPLYTLPLIVAVIWAWRVRARARRSLGVGLAISSAYLAVTLVLQWQATQVFRQELHRQGIEHGRLFVKPTFLNALLWRAVAEAPEAYWVGFHSLLDEDRRVRFERAPAGRELLTGLQGAGRELWALNQATDGYLQALPAPPGLLVRDMRYGSGTDWLPPEQDRPYVFTYRLLPTGSGWRLEQVDTRGSREEETGRLGLLWRRVLGEE